MLNYVFFSFIIHPLCLLQRNEFIEDNSLLESETEFLYPSLH